MFKWLKKSAVFASVVVACCSWSSLAGETPMPGGGGVTAPDMSVLQNIFGGAKRGETKGRASLKAVKKLLIKERKVSVTEMGGRIFLDGTVTSEQTRKRIDILLKVYENLVDLTEYQPDEDTMLADTELIKQRIEYAMNRHYDPLRAFTSKQEVTVEIVNSKIVLSGDINNPADVKQALSIAKIYNKNVVNALTVRKQMIEISAIFAKVLKKKGDKVGTTGLQSAIIQMSSLIAASPDGAAGVRYPFDLFRNYKFTGTPAKGGFNNQGTTEADNLLKIDFSSRYEKSSVLARPHLSTINGENAEFLAGGEKAIKTTTANTSDVEYKKFGVILKIKPVFTTDGRIELSVSLEFSVPVANGDDFITFLHKGDAILSRNQGMSLSGLVNEARSRGVVRTPGLSRVPILSFFFGQKVVNNDGEELVLIVIPKIPKVVTSAPYATSDRTTKVAEDAMWIKEPSLPRRGFERAKGKKGKHWIEAPVEQEVSREEKKLMEEVENLKKAPAAKEPQSKAPLPVEEAAEATAPPPPPPPAEVVEEATAPPPPPPPTEVTVEATVPEAVEAPKAVVREEVVVAAVVPAPETPAVVAAPAAERVIEEDVPGVEVPGIPVIGRPLPTGVAAAELENIE